MKISRSNAKGNYVDKLVASIQKDVNDHAVDVDDIRCEIDDDNIYATITQGKSVKELEIPIKDLSMIDIDEDKDYIFGYLDSDDDDDWELQDSKEVTWGADETWYNMWYSPSRNLYAFTLGDPDIERPEDGYNDWEADSYESAIEWFDDWNGDDSEDYDDDEEYDDDWDDYDRDYEEDVDLFSSTQITSSDGIFTGDEIFEWVTSHPEIEKEALEDFNVESLKDVKCSELSDWVFSSTDIANKAMKDLGKKNDEE